MNAKFEEMTKAQLVEALNALGPERRVGRETDDALRLLHELQVHQIELEMQNRELREAQGALEESRGRYADLFDLAPVGYVTLDLAGHICEANLCAAALLGKSRADLNGAALAHFVPLGQRDTLRRHLQECVTTRRQVTTELTLAAKNAEPTEVQTVSIPVIGSDGAVAACRTTLTDITLLRTALQTLHFLSDASEALSSSLDHAETVGMLARLAVPFLADICVVDVLEEENVVRRLKVAFSSPSAKAAAAELEATTIDVNGSTLQARVLRSGEPVLLGDTKEAPASVRSKEIARGATSLMVVPLTARGRTLGALTFVHFGARHYADRDLSLAMDVARRAAMSIDNARLYQLAQDAIHAREDLLAVVSHDLRNPLSSITFAAALLLDSAPQAERRKGRKQLEAIRRGAERMERMIGDLLDLSSIEAGHLSIDRRDHELGTLVAEARDLFTPSLKKRGLAFSVEASGEDVQVRCDRDRVMQVLTNLVDNALKFTPQGGAISIGVDVEGNEARFAVKDTGPGIPKEQRRRLFDRYWRANEKNKVGRGLGLYIAHGIVVAQGGRMWVESEVGRGSTFYFTLPVTEAGVTAAAAVDARPPGYVLVVDDEEHSREALASILESAGYEVERCIDGRDALRHITSGGRRPELILLDLDMPELDGEAFISEVRKEKALSTIPIVLVSSRRNLAEQAAALGVSGYLGKPVKRERLFTVLNGRSN